MAEDLSALLQNSGYEMPQSVNEPIKNEGVSFYEHPAGDYKALIGRLEFSYKDADSNKCDPTKAGAKLVNGGLKFLIVQDPEKVILNLPGGYKYFDGIEYGRKFYNQFITIDPQKQWQNVRVFKDFVFEGLPESAVVQGEKNAENIFLKNIPLFMGVPISFTIEQSTKGSRYIKEGSLKLLDKSFSREKFVSRKEVVSIIYKGYDEELKIMKEKAAKNKAGNAVPEVKPPDTNDFLGAFIGDQK